VLQQVPPVSDASNSVRTQDPYFVRLVQVLVSAVLQNSGGGVQDSQTIVQGEERVGISCFHFQLQIVPVFDVLLEKGIEVIE
jgi:hypothetical protein